MTNLFWERESERLYRQKQATEWQKKVQKDAWERMAQFKAERQGLPTSIVPMNEFNLFNKKLVQPQDLEEIVPGKEEKKGGGGILGALDDVASTVFMGEVRQPWDLLRPVQRLLEAEQKHIARPIAQLVLSPLPGGYEDQPRLLRTLTEAVVDPLNYVGPGALTKAVKLVSMAPEAKLALPGVEALFGAPGSRKAAISVLKNAGYALSWVGGAEAAEQVGVPGVLGGGAGVLALGRAPGFRAPRPSDEMVVSVRNSDDMRVLHGTRRLFDDLPSPEVSGTNFPGSSIPGVVYASTNPEFANNYAPPWGAQSDSPRIIPMVIKAGSQIWDPDEDPWPRHIKVGEGTIPTTKIKAYWHTHKRTGIPGIPESEAALGSYFFDSLNAYLSAPSKVREVNPVLPAFVEEIKKSGYHAIKTGDEVLVLDNRVLMPYWTPERFPGMSIAKPDFDEVQTFPIGLKSRFKPWLYDLNPSGYSPDNQTLENQNYIAFERGGNLSANSTRISFHRDRNYPNVYEVMIYREGAVDWGGRNSGGSDLRQLAEVRDVLEDIVRNNPDAQFWAGPTDMRREKVYRLAGMEPIGLHHPKEVIAAAGGSYDPSLVNDPSRRWAVHLTLNKEKFLNQVARRNPTIGNDQMLGIVNPESDEMQRLLRLEDEALEREWARSNQRALDSSSETQAAAGEVLTDQLQQSLESRGLRQAAGGSDTGLELGQLLIRLARAGQDMFDTKSVEGVFEAANLRKRNQSRVREWLGNNLPQPVQEYFQKHNIRLKDSSVTMYVNEYNRMVSLRHPYAATVGDELRHTMELMNEQDYLRTREIRTRGTVVDDAALVSQARTLEATYPDIFEGNRLVSDSGELFLDDLQMYRELFSLTPQQRSALEALDAPYGPHRQFEELFELKPNVAEYGAYAHKEPMRLKVGGQVSQGGDAVSDTAMVLANRGERIRTRAKSIDQGKLTHAESVSQGDTFLPYVEAQQARVSAGYKAMADKWLGLALENEGMSRADYLPDELVASLQNVTQLARQTKAIMKEYNRLLGSSRGTSWQPPPFRDTHPMLVEYINQANGASHLKKAERDAVISDLKARLQGVIDATDVEYQTLRSRKKELLDQFKDPGSVIRRMYPIEWHGKFYPQSAGRELQALERAKNPSDISGFVQEVNNAIRPVMATLDVSFLGVQGLIAALSNPIPYFKAMKTVFTSGYGDYEARLHRSGDLYKMIKDGVHWASRNDVSEFLFPSWLSHTPIVGGLAETSNSWFSQFGNVLRSELYRASIQSGMESATRQQLARTVNLISGFNPNDPTSIEKSLMFAPRFFRSQLGLIADAVTKRDLSHDGAARALGTFITSGIALTYIANEALGNETVFDPDDPNFLRIRFGDRDMSVFGTWDTLARALSKTFYGSPEDGAAYLARVKASPFISRVWDVIDGETLGGQELIWGSPGDVILSAAKYSSGFLPLSAQQLLQEPPDLTNPGSVMGSGLQFLGTKSTPMSPSERMEVRRQELARSEFGKSWDDLEPYQQNTLREQYGLTLPSKSTMAKAFESRRAIGERFESAQQRIDATLPMGPEWIEAYQNLKREQSGAYAQWGEENPEALARIRHSKPRTENERVQQEFYALFDRADVEGWTGGELSDAIDAFEQRVGSAKMDYIQRNSGFRDTEQVREFKAAQRQLGPYWDLGDQIFERMKSRLPRGNRYTSLQDWINATILELQEAGMSDAVILRRVQQNPVVRQIDRATRDLRERYRRRHPETDRLLVQWYGAVPIASQR